MYGSVGLDTTREEIHTMTLAKSKAGRGWWLGLLTMASGCVVPSIIAAGAGDRPARGSGNKALATDSQCRILQRYGNGRFYVGGTTACGAFSPQSRHVVIGTSWRFRKGPGTTVWDLSGKKLAAIDLQPTDLQFSPDGATLYALASDGILRAFETAGWTPKWHLRVLAGKGASMVLNRRELRILDPSHGVTLIDLKARAMKDSQQTGTFLKGKLSPDGSLVALYTGTPGKYRLSIQEALSGRLLRSLDFNHGGSPVAFAISRDNRLLAFSEGNRVVLVNLASGDRQELKKGGRPRSVGTPGDNHICAYPTFESFTDLSFSDRGDLLTGTTTTDGLYRFHLGEKIDVKRSSFGRIKGLVLSPDDTKALILGDHGLVARLCEMPSGKPLLTPQSTWGSGRIFFSPDRSYFAMLCENYTIRIYSAATAKLMATINHNHPVNQIVFTPDGKWMVGGDNLWKVVVWQTGSWEKKHVITDHHGCVSAVALGPDQQTLYSGDEKGVLIVRDLATWEQRASLRVSAKRNPGIGAVMVNSDHILLGTRKATVEVFDRKTMKPLQILAAPSRPSNAGGVYYVHALAHSPEANTYCALSHDVLHTWDSRTLKPLKTIDLGKTKGSTRVAYTPGGRHIVVTGFSAGMRIYNASTGKQLVDYSDVAAHNVGDMYWEDGKLIATIATEGYTAQKLAIRLEPVAADQSQQK